jgi:hypothetical protein
MKYFRLTLIAVALAAASIGLGVANTSGPESQEAARCQRCGDGVCAKSCENAQTCPQDCAPQPIASSTAH